jgi:hypothetical protein
MEQGYCGFCHDWTPPTCTRAGCHHGETLTSPRVIEFGGSNQFIREIFDYPGYEIVANYPAVDVQDLKTSKRRLATLSFWIRCLSMSRIS